jgi:hypothetical protein
LTLRFAEVVVMRIEQFKPGDLVRLRNLPEPNYSGASNLGCIPVIRVGEAISTGTCGPMGVFEYYKRYYEGEAFQVVSVIASWDELSSGHPQCVSILMSRNGGGKEIHRFSGKWLEKVDHQ